MEIFKVINSKFEINGIVVPLIQSPTGEVFGVKGNDVVEIEGSIDSPVVTDIKIGKIVEVKGGREIINVTVELI